MTLEIPTWILWSLGAVGVLLVLALGLVLFLWLAFRDDWHPPPNW